MPADYVQPFVDSTASVFETMLACRLEVAEITTGRYSVATDAVSGVVGLTGDAAGTVVLRLPREAAFSATQALLGERPSEVNAEVKDAVGELTNMIAGGAKTRLAEWSMNLTIPTIVTGTSCIEFPSTMEPTCIEFNSPWGSFSIEVGLVEQTLPTRA